MQNLQVENSSTTLRYSADTARQVLARASEIEQTNQDTLSVAQIEALGRELGLSPDAVRRALGELQPAPTTTASSVTTAQANMPLIRQREVRGILASGAVVGGAIGIFLFFLLNFVSMTGILAPSPAMAVVVPLVLLFMVYVLAPLLSYRHGWYKGDSRVGMIAGVWSGICAAVSAYIGILLGVNTFPPVGNGFLAPVLYNVVGTPGTLLLMIIAAIIAGAAGAKVRHWWNGLQRAEER